MEEDIKILEKMVELNKSKLAEYKSTGVWYNEDTEMYTNCIENLIKGYRRLELENQALKNTKDTCPNMATSGIRCDIKSNHIPKSKIKEKIEELTKEFDFYAGREHAEWQDGEFDGDMCDDIALKIGALKELMEDK